MSESLRSALFLSPFRLGISSCLLGQKVRFDGGDKLEPFLTGTFGRYVEFVPVCPEVEFGLGVPREPMRLEGSVESPRLVTVRTREDHTEGMLRWVRKRVRELEREELCGFIFKSRSPSSGMRGVSVYGREGIPEKAGVGLFAKAFLEHFPLLPCEDEERLRDPEIRENFIGRIFVLRRFREAGRQKNKIEALVEFHRQHDLLLLSHSTGHHTIARETVFQLQQGQIEAAEAWGRYQAVLVEALRQRATLSRHSVVLRTILGLLDGRLPDAARKEAESAAALYREELVPLLSPLCLLGFLARQHGPEYLLDQYYLFPEPLELMLKYHA